QVALAVPLDELGIDVELAAGAEAVTPVDHLALVSNDRLTEAVARDVCLKILELRALHQQEHVGDQVNLVTPVVERRRDVDGVVGHVDLVVSGDGVQALPPASAVSEINVRPPRWATRRTFSSRQASTTRC